MKRIFILLFVFLSFKAIAQETKEIYGHLSQVLVPNNILTGVGYSFGYHFNTDKCISYKAEFGMSTAYRERPMDFTENGIHYKNLYYNLAQYNLTFMPTLHLLKTKRWDLNAGLGLSGVYQGKISIFSHYEYSNFMLYDRTYEAMSVDASAGYHAEIIGALGLKYKIAEKWWLQLSSRYQINEIGETMLVNGLGLGYAF